MQSRALIPMIDLVFLTLGGILAVMTQMEHVTSIPVEITRVGRGAAVVQQGRLSVVAMTRHGLTLDGQPTTRQKLVDEVAGRNIVLRADRELPTERTVGMVALLAKAGANVSLEVKEQKTLN